MGIKLPIENFAFEYRGVHCVVDGQFGSTGKGALAAFLASKAVRRNWGGCISNAGPNSGHTFYYGAEKHVLKQLPSFAVYLCLMGHPIPVYLSGGAIIDPAILAYEATKYPSIPIFVHPNAAVILAMDKEQEHSGTIAAVAGTQSGTGAAIARKVLRDPTAVFSDFFGKNAVMFPPNVICGWPQGQYALGEAIRQRPFFMEVSQGFSLGINSGFYPKTTSRECTVAQGMADAGLPPQMVSKVYLSLRTFPIRVGDHNGFSSGGHYPDQKETSWEALGFEPELTTVTKRVRRVFTFSDQQAYEAILANSPDYVFINFMNYLKTDEEQRVMLEKLDWLRDGGYHWFDIIQGWGPKVEDVRW